MWKRDTERSIIKMNRMTFDLSLIMNLYSAECDEATLALFAGRRQPVLDGGVGLRRVSRGGTCGVALPRVPLGGA